MIDPEAYIDELLARDEATSWDEVNLGPILAGEIIETPPTMLMRSDGLGLLYAGRMHSFQGETESLKTWLALKACAEQVIDDRDVPYVDFEDSPSTVVARLRQLAVPDDAIYERFHYLRPDEPLTEAAANAWRTPSRRVSIASRCWTGSPRRSPFTGST